MANYILEHRDLGCRGASRVVEMEEEKLMRMDGSGLPPSVNEERFWSLLGGGSVNQVTSIYTCIVLIINSFLDNSIDFSVPDDAAEECYEDKVNALNMVYFVEQADDPDTGKVVLSDDFSRKPLRHEMLKENQV